MKDPSKPDGEAVNADGTLKPADQIKWLNSPTDELRPPILNLYKDKGDAAPGKVKEQKKNHVSYYESQGHNKDSPFSAIWAQEVDV